MVFVPLPFVVALLLVILFAALLRRHAGARRNQPFLALIALCALQSVLVGLRWGYGIAEVRYVLPVAAACVPPLVYASFRSLTDRDPPRRQGLLITAAPVALVALLVFAAPSLIDPILIILYLAHALALLALARSGPDALDDARLEGVIPAYRALQFAALALCASALFDFLVMFDFEWANGANVPALVSNANLLGLLLLGLAAAVAGRSSPGPEAQREPALATAFSSAEESDVFSRIDTLMLTRMLYRDENLSLARLARQAGMPARRISGAINRIAGKNVSQYVNEHRIAEACRRLKDTDDPVTAIMFDVGFQTKSNFNREFRRLIGDSPVVWREKNKAG